MSHDTKPLWLVQPRLDAAEYRDKLMGCVVKYADLPLERRIPYRSGKLPRDLVPNLDPKPVQVRNVRFWTRRIKDAKVSASVNEILEAFGERAKEDSHKNVATVARVWHMDSPGEKFKELLKNKQYFEELFELLRDNHGEGYFVTDIVTLTNLETTDETTRKKGAGAGAQVPLDPAFGVDIHAKGSFHVVREKGYSACYEEEAIVFLGYRRIKLEKVTGARARFERVFLGQKHGFTVRDGFDHWPEMIERPVEGNAEPFLGAQTPKTEEPPVLMDSDLDEIAGELGYDVEVVG
ncbi:hypothetical protein LIA77_05776 [Sarocladium implicatum]|nr:hypothetical protein LIA77_05776 [Sarocladium implicatum]